MVVCAFIQEMQAKQQKRQAAHKRRMAEVDQLSHAITADAEAKIRAVRKKASRMSSLARVLQPFARPRTPASPSA